MIFEITEKQRIEIKAHAIEAFEASAIECCGFILNTGEVMPCENTSDAPETNFVISAQECTKAYRRGVAAIYHSHVSGDGSFSWSDGKGCRSTGKPWVLYNIPTNDFNSIDPNGAAPYLNRRFCWWIQDCYELIRDYYRQEFSINLDLFERPELSSTPRIRWQPKDWNGFQESFQSQCFFKIDENQKIKRGDVILFALHGGNANHIGVMHDLENGHFLHQLAGDLSRVDIWADAWSRSSVGILRHKELM
jgi:proteasome lid subunit RPN8/RPN11